MIIEHGTIESCAEGIGLVVVVDVMRAFTAAVLVFAEGAEQIVLVSAAEEAFSLRKNAWSTFDGRGARYPPGSI